MHYLDMHTVAIYATRLTFKQIFVKMYLSGFLQINQKTVAHKATHNYNIDYIFMYDINGLSLTFTINTYIQPPQKIYISYKYLKDVLYNPKA